MHLHTTFFLDPRILESVTRKPVKNRDNTTSEEISFGDIRLSMREGQLTYQHQAGAVADVPPALAEFVTSVTLYTPGCLPGHRCGGIYKLGLAEAEVRSYTDGHPRWTVTIKGPDLQSVKWMYINLLEGAIAPVVNAELAQVPIPQISADILARAQTIMDRTAEQMLLRSVQALADCVSKG